MIVGVFLTLGTGIGGTVFLENKIVGFELGHMIICKNGKECSCGQKGCFEAYASMKAFRDKIRIELNLPKSTNGKIIKEKVLQNLNNIKIQRIIDEYISDLSIGLINFINIFNLDTISIGGSFSYYNEIFLEKLNNKMNTETIVGKTNKINIITAKFKNDAGMLGAILEF